MVVVAIIDSIFRSLGHIFSISGRIYSVLGLSGAKGLFRHSSNLGDKLRCSVPISHDIVYLSFTDVSCDKESFSKNTIPRVCP